MHRFGDVAWGLNSLQLNAGDLGAPFVGGVIKDLAELGIDNLTGGQRLIK